MSEDRPVHTDALKTLGTIISSKEQRDAIHLAVEPVQAGENLMPGWDVGFLEDGTVGVHGSYLVGIVDPFLEDEVKKGEWFWLVVYPRRITSLRHVWEHPQFPPVETTIIRKADKANAEKWMRVWAMEHMSCDYYGDGEDNFSEDAAYEQAINAGHNLSVGPYESARDHIDDTWWDHWETITGGKGQRGEYFSCGC